VNGSPEQTIRRYLDEHGGKARVPAHNLLTTWDLEEFTDASRREIQEALAHVGVRTNPSLTAVGENDPVELYLAPRKTASAGVWQRFRRRPAWAQVVIPVAAIALMVAALAALEASFDEDKAETREEQIQRQRARERQLRTAAKRTRERLQRERATGEGPPLERENEPPNLCDPNYVPCVPAYPPDVDCADVKGQVSVRRSDPHHLDPDGNGKGCDT
jgi:hypothetical protein